MIRIQIRKDEIELSKRLQKEFDAQKSYNKFPSENNYIGVLGEIVLHRWLTEQNIEHVWINYVKKTRGNEDFIINGKKIDLKTIFDTKMWLQKFEHDVYLFSRVNDDLMELLLIGFIEKKTLEKLKIKDKLDIFYRPEYKRHDFIIRVEQMKAIEEIFKQN